MWKVMIYPKWYSKKHCIDLLEEMGARFYKTSSAWVIQTENRSEVENQIRKLRVGRKWTKTEWERSATYRKHFLESTSGPYHCRYCNRLLKKEYMQVDHLVPVAKVQQTEYAKTLLKIAGVTDVNDIHNLVPSCSRCNQAKGEKLGLWYIRGLLGKYKKYWVAVDVLRASFISAAIGAIVWCVVSYH